MTLKILIIEKNASLKSLSIKNYKEEELYKKCGFKSAEGFKLQTIWNVKIDSQKYIIYLYAKLKGKVNTENKYEFPPPVDNLLYFGNCALVAYKSLKENDSIVLVDLTIELWNKIYETLFGGFEDLKVNSIEDEEEEDELENIPKNMKTKTGYLKDGFVIDDTSDVDEIEDDDSTDVSNDDNNEAFMYKLLQLKEKEKEKTETIEDINYGSELSEEEYL
jgi:hypothetical protein